MKLLTKNKLNEIIKNNDIRGFYISPLLDINQIGEISLDLRLGFDFYVSVNTRYSKLSLYDENGVGACFQITKREFGEPFLLFPGQLVVTNTLEYIKLPEDILVELNTRSSVNKIGISFNSIVQPGFTGCFPLELYNNSNNVIELIAGMRLVQARIYQLDEKTNYLDRDRKYFCHIKPQISKIISDEDNKRFRKLNK
ncbi:MAG: dCTP deaminase [Candidatus Absconditabacterales bacterium]|nr:dCTP deaminase [Candidatus Absconditabacterales bacterium]